MADPRTVASIQEVSGDQHDPHRLCYGCKCSEVGAGGFYYCDTCFDVIKDGGKLGALALSPADQAVERAWEKNR